MFQVGGGGGWGVGGGLPILEDSLKMILYWGAQNLMYMCEGGLPKGSLSLPY